jgi:hypothetical protein
MTTLDNTAGPLAGAGDSVGPPDHSCGGAGVRMPASTAIRWPSAVDRHRGRCPTGGWRDRASIGLQAVDRTGHRIYVLGGLIRDYRRAA